MPRVKRGKGHLKRRKALHRQTKGFEAGRKNLVKLAKTAVLKAGAHAHRDRRVKKRDFRSLWQVRINAAARLHGLSYSEFMGKLKAKGILLDRKVLSELAVKYPAVFTSIVEAVK